MKVRIVCFGSVRETVGSSSLELDLAAGATAGDAWAEVLKRYAGLQKYERSVAVAVNQSFASPSTVLKEGDEVGLLPPVSGGAPDGVPLESEHTRLQSEPIVTHEVTDRLRHPENGSLVVFDGVVRNNTRGRRTLYLEYEAYPAMAVQEMENLATTALKQFAIRDVRIVHRVGRQEIGDTTVTIVVASGHRAAAFEACRWIIDTLKKRVPVWKKEFFEDGAVWADGEDFPDEVKTL